jgi:hypothetical protein
LPEPGRVNEVLKIVGLRFRARGNFEHQLRRPSPLASARVSWQSDQKKSLPSMVNRMSDVPLLDRITINPEHFRG